MGACVEGYWPGITEAESARLPAFKDDCKAYGDWMADREEVEADLRTLGGPALLSFTTDGIEDDEVDWTTPAELGDSCRRLIAAIQSNADGAQRILDSYEPCSNGVDPVQAEFLSDLESVIAMADEAHRMGVTQMTLSVSW